MENSLAVSGLRPNKLLQLPASPNTYLLGGFFPLTRSPSSLKLTNRFCSSSHVLVASRIRCKATTMWTISRDAADLADINWDGLGFGLVPTDYMYIMKCSRDGNFTEGELKNFGNIELSPSSGILNYGQLGQGCSVDDDEYSSPLPSGNEAATVTVQMKFHDMLRNCLDLVVFLCMPPDSFISFAGFLGLFEGLKAYRKEDGGILLFRPEENAIRMRMGAERMCMPSPSVEQFVDAVKLTVLANKRWVPPPSKGSLYIRPLLMGSGTVLGLAPAPEYTFLIYVSPVGNYFKEGLAPINLVVENEFHRATPGGTGGVKTIGNYAAVLKAQTEAKAKGYSDVVYLDSVNKRNLEEVSSCNIFIVKDKTVSTPAIQGTILPGITRKSIIDVARSQGYQVEERLVSVDELLDADEVFCTGTAVVVSPVRSITYLGNRVTYGNKGVGVVSQQLYTALTSIQMGLKDDKMGWTVEIN